MKTHQSCDKQSKQIHIWSKEPTAVTAAAAVGAASGLSSSTSITAPVDPLVQMGFDPNFLDELRDRYGELNHDDIEALNLEDFEVRGYGGQRNSGEGLTNQSLSMSGDISAPVSIPNSASAFEHTSEAVML